MSLEDFDRIGRVVFSDPKFLAMMEWSRKYAARIEGVPEEELRYYAETGRHVHPERMVRIVVPDEPMPNFDWWEPRYDTPGRRQQTAYREAGL